MNGSQIRCSFLRIVNLGGALCIMIEMVAQVQKLGQAGGSQFSNFSRISRSKRGGARPGGFQAIYCHGGRFQASCGRRGGFQATCGHGGFLEGHGRCGSGRRKKTSDKSADQLDKELDSYHAEAMNTS